MTEKTLNRGNPIDYDFYGCGAVGDVEYDDHYDKWENIKKAIESAEEVPIIPNHQETDEVIGYIRNHELDNCNKKVYVGFNNDDVSVNIGDISNISPQWRVVGDEIVGINHWAIGNGFNQICDDDVCGIERVNRSEKMEDNEEKEEKDVPEEEADDDEEELSEDEEIALGIADITMKILNDKELEEEEIDMVQEIFSDVLDRGEPKEEESEDSELELTGAREDKKQEPVEIQESILGKFEYKNIKNY